MSLILRGDHILRFNLSIVPGITEFRRKNNAYHETHAKLSTIKHSSQPWPKQRLRMTCIFMRPFAQISAQIFLKTKIMPFRRCKQHLEVKIKISRRNSKILNTSFTRVFYGSTDTINIHSVTSCNK